jgi:hypothetical protein
LETDALGIPSEQFGGKSIKRFVQRWAVLGQDGELRLYESQGSVRILHIQERTVLPYIFLPASKAWRHGEAGLASYGRKFSTRGHAAIRRFASTKMLTSRALKIDVIFLQSTLHTFFVRFLHTTMFRQSTSTPHIEI